MSDSMDDVAQKFIDELMTDNGSTPEETSDLVKNLKTLAEAKKLLDPEPEPVPEPTGAKAFFGRHGGDFIKGGFTLAAVVVIATIEAKGDVIFRSKATKYL